MKKQNEPPTTLEMDKLLTDEDIKNRYIVMKPCISCLKYNKQDIKEKDKLCVYCESPLGINGRYWYSLRTFTGDKKLTAADQKKLGTK